MNLVRLHRWSAFGLIGFIALHLFNHLVGAIQGPEAHLATQALISMVYRAPIIEPILIAAVSIQIVTGLRMVAKRGWPRSRTGKLRTISGAYLAFFLIAHLGAVLQARWIGVETNIHFAAAGIHAGGIWPWIFIPHYAGAILAIGCHLTMAAMRRWQSLSIVGWVGAILTIGICCLALSLLTGVLHDIAVPDEYLEQFR